MEKINFFEAADAFVASEDKGADVQPKLGLRREDLAEGFDMDDKGNITAFPGWRLQDGKWGQVEKPVPNNATSQHSIPKVTEVASATQPSVEQTELPKVGNTQTDNAVTESVDVTPSGVVTDANTSGQTESDKVGIVKPDVIKAEWQDLPYGKGFDERRQRALQNYKWEADQYNNLSEYLATNKKPELPDEKKHRWGKIAASIADIGMCIADMIGSNKGLTPKRTNSALSAYIAQYNAKRKMLNSEMAEWEKGRRLAAKADTDGQTSAMKSLRSALDKVDADQAKDKDNVDRQNAIGRANAAKQNIKAENDANKVVAKANNDMVVANHKTDLKIKEKAAPKAPSVIIHRGGGGRRSGGSSRGQTNFHGQNGLVISESDGKRILNCAGIPHFFTNGVNKGKSLTKAQVGRLAEMVLSGECNGWRADDFADYFSGTELEDIRPEAWVWKTYDKGYGDSNADLRKYRKKYGY